MPNLILFDLPAFHRQLLPLTFTRPVAELRCGIFTIREKWEKYFGKASWLSEEYLQEAYPCNYAQDNLYINASLLPSTELAEMIGRLENNEGIVSGNVLLAAKGGWIKRTELVPGTFKVTEGQNAELITRPWHIFQYNGAQIRSDFSHVVSSGKNYGVGDKYTIQYKADQIFVAEGVKVKASVLNAENGPIFIGAGCEVQEGSLVRGPFAMCEGSILSMGAKIKGDTTIGPYCKIGGEVSNSVIIGYSNKGHDGFMGNSVIGEWCNLGADTNTSNLKNNYSEVSIYSYAENGMVGTGSQFCGLTMGDHSKAGINTMFNTGTVVGVSANVFDGEFPPKHVPSFSWGKTDRYNFAKAIDTAKRVMERRNKTLSDAEIRILQKVHNES